MSQNIVDITDHKSYTRHFESSKSEAAKRDLPALAAISGSKSHQSLAQLSATLSASSSLSGSTHKPLICDDDEDDEEEDGEDDIHEDMSNSDSSINNESVMPLNPITPSATHHSNQSLSSFTTTSNEDSKSLRRFKHYHKPKVTETPRLVYLTNVFINERNIDGLALIARRRGLPPKTRQTAWPLLLASHPYVLNPSLVPEYPLNSPDSTSEAIPLKRITNEIKRCQKRIEQEHFNNNTSMNSTGVLGNSIDNLSNERNSTTCIVDVKTGEIVLQEKLDELRNSKIKSAVIKFLEKWSHLVSYDSGLVHLAFALADWVDPVSRRIEETSASSTTTHTPSSRTISFDLPYEFETVYENLVLIVSHVARDQAAGPKGPCDNSTSDRISFWLSIVRHHLPELAKHFDEEDVLSSVSGAGDEWLLWWIKWLGTKVWDKKDRARIWDMYFGWRPLLVKMENLLQGEAISSNGNTTPDGTGKSKSGSGSNSNNGHSVRLANDVVVDLAQLEIDLGPDPFWDIEETTCTDSGDESEIASASEPLLEHLFVCLAMLKSKCGTLMELDQSEIRGCLGRLYRSKDIESIVVEAGDCWRSWRYEENTIDNE